MTTSRPTLLIGTVLVAGAASALTVLPAAAADQPLHLTTVAVPDRNTDLDLGQPGPSAGDTQVFLDDVQRDGRTVGTSAGSCTVTTISETRLAGACTATLVLPGGVPHHPGRLRRGPRHRTGRLHLGGHRRDRQLRGGRG